jgi:hypothetical protein
MHLRLGACIRTLKGSDRMPTRALWLARKARCLCRQQAAPPMLCSCTGRPPQLGRLFERLQRFPQTQRTGKRVCLAHQSLSSCDLGIEGHLIDAHGAGWAVIV